FIGTDKAGTAPIPNNYGVDVEIQGATGNVIGGTAAGARNVLSGNNFDGVLIGNNASANLVQGNFVGTDVTGAIAVPNGNNGVELFASAHGNTVGGNTVAARNLLSGNAHAGVELDFSASANSVVGN